MAGDPPVDPLAERADRPRAAVGGTPDRGLVERLDRRVGIGAAVDRRAPDRVRVRDESALPRAAELGQLGVPASLADPGQIREQCQHVLEVADREAERLVALQEPVHDQRPSGSDPGARALGRQA